MTTLNFADMSMADLVAYYNANSDTPVKRFADRKSAERRCAALPVAPAEAPAETVIENPYAEVDASLMSDYGMTRCPHCNTHLGNGVGHHLDEVNGKYIKHDQFEFACLACNGEFGRAILKRSNPKGAGVPRPVMQESLKLDRQIVCLETAQVWKNAYRMWLENPAWMTSSQQDRLTSQLYAAAKRGERIVVEVQGRHFELLNVAKAAA